MFSASLHSPEAIEDMETNRLQIIAHGKPWVSHSYVDFLLDMNNRTKESPLVNYRIQHIYQTTITKGLQTNILHVLLTPTWDCSASKKGSFAGAGLQHIKLLVRIISNLGYPAVYRLFMLIYRYL
jgi:hypothetical protein